MGRFRAEALLRNAKAGSSNLPIHKNKKTNSDMTQSWVLE